MRQVSSKEIWKFKFKHLIRKSKYIYQIQKNPKWITVTKEAPQEIKYQGLVRLLHIHISIYIYIYLYIHILEVGSDEALEIRRSLSREDSSLVLVCRVNHDCILKSAKSYFVQSEHNDLK